MMENNMIKEEDENRNDLVEQIEEMRIRKRNALIDDELEAYYVLKEKETFMKKQLRAYDRLMGYTK